MTDKPPRRRRWIPVSLRIFVAILGLLAVGSGLWIGVPAYRQKTALDEFDRRWGLGCKVSLCDLGPPWLSAWLGDSWSRSFYRVDSVSFLMTDASDEDLSVLKGLPQIRHLTLPVGFRQSREVSDAGLRHLKSLTELEDLSLNGTGVTDDGLKQLSSLRRLTHLFLSGTRVTGTGLAHVTELKDLAYLHLGQSQITDAGLAEVAHLTNLKSLDLGGTKITDAGLVHLGSLRNLKRVYLRGTLVTPNGVSELKRTSPNLLVRL